MAAGSAFVVRIAYTAKRPRLGLHFVLPTSDRPDKPTMVYSHAEPLQARYWLPCHDWPDTRWPSDVYISVPEAYRAVCVGEPVEEPVAREVDGDPRGRQREGRLLRFGGRPGEFYISGPVGLEDEDVADADECVGVLRESR